jgi:hypothetical protein
MNPISPEEASRRKSRNKKPFLSFVLVRELGGDAEAISPVESTPS